MNEHGRNDRDILRYTDVEYTPEGYENVYRWDDFLEIAGGDARYAAMLIDRTVAGEPEEGLHPETLVDQDIRDGEAFMLAGRPIVPEDVYDLPRTVHGLYSELVDNVGRSGTLLRDWRGFSAGADADDVLREIEGAFGEHTDPEDIRAVEGSVSMTGALMAAAMASYDLSCGLVDDKHIERYDNVITALEERMGFGTGMLSVQTEAGELVANVKEDGISVGMNLPGGKCVDIAFVDADPAADDLHPTPVRAFTYNGCDEEPDHRTDVHLDGAMVLEGQTCAETPAHVPGDVATAAKEAAAKSAKADAAGKRGIKQ